MRIISQDGANDVPYENAELERKGKIISVWTLETVYSNFASYSTEEKAIKAMEMCRKQYAQCEFTRAMIPETANNFEKMQMDIAEKVRNQICENFIFQFPADKEV